MVELILAYALLSTEPLYMRETGPPYANYEVALNIEKDLPWRFYMQLQPYIKAYSNNLIGRAGATAHIGLDMGDLKVEFYHWSEHNLDKDSIRIESDGVRLKWKLL